MLFDTPDSQDQRNGLDLEELETQAAIEVPGRELLSVMGVGFLPAGVMVAAGLLPDSDLQPMPGDG